ncbi:ATP-binding protein [Azospirillum aestuarii]|uniref:ATP-binding protein n=1 Tax=Azospirillum aestuarii TaxID=2802052 RepID=UPI004054DBF2
MARTVHQVEDLPPHASDLSKSLRGIGYSVETALADLIDNSIAAGARKVRVAFAWRGNESCISCMDDGNGMDERTLREAMRLGRDPADARASNDLGRFGLGLKMASWSQCKVVTVRSKQRGTAPATRRWDLDHINASDRWEVMTSANPASEPDLAALDAEQAGTVVLWENLDTLRRAGVLRSSADYWAMVDKVEKHLAMIFHRFLDTGRLSLLVNGQAVRGWDPFMTGHSLRRESPSEVIWSIDGRHSVVFSGYALPHRKHLTDEEYEAAGGPSGWIAGQGFYVYRLDRLILRGGWLGLGRASRPWKPDQASRLARISLDITNAADLDWSINLIKSTAEPPTEFRERLRTLGDHMRRWSKKLDAQETRPRPSQIDGRSVWIAPPNAPPRIDRRHPAVLRALSAAGVGARELRALLDLIDETTPVGALQIAPPSVSVSKHVQDDEAALRLAVNILFTLQRGTGMSRDAARERLVLLPQFKNRPDLVDRALVMLDQDS